LDKQCYRQFETNNPPPYMVTFLTLTYILFFIKFLIIS
jgi:hypothetical protein